MYGEHARSYYYPEVPYKLIWKIRLIPVMADLIETIYDEEDGGKERKIIYGFSGEIRIEYQCAYYRRQSDGEHDQSGRYFKNIFFHIHLAQARAF